MGKRLSFAVIPRHYQHREKIFARSGQHKHRVVKLDQCSIDTLTGSGRDQPPLKTPAHVRLSRFRPGAHRSAASRPHPVVDDLVAAPEMLELDPRPFVDGQRRGEARVSGFLQGVELGALDLPPLNDESAAL